MKIKQNPLYLSQVLRALLGISVACCSFTAAAENLLEVYGMAISSDPTLQQAYANRMATREAFPTALAGFLPNLTGTAQLNMNDSDLQALFGNGGSQFANLLPEQDIARYQQVLANVTQPIFNLGLWHSLKQAKQTVSYADAAYMASEQDLIIRTATVYFNILEAMDNLAFVQAQKEAVGRQLGQTKDKFNAGLVAITDVKDLQAQYDSSLAQEIAAYNDISNRRQQLKILTGEFVEQVDGLKKLPLISRTHR